MKKRIASLLLAVLLTAAMLTGCGAKADSTAQSATGEKISISMYLWDRSMFKEFTPWLEQQFPDIEFTFVQSYNTMDYYKYLSARGAASFRENLRQVMMSGMGSPRASRSL